MLAGFVAVLEFAWVTRASDAATFSFQEGVAGYAGSADTYLSEDRPTKVRGGEQMLWWDTSNPQPSGNAEITLIRFDGLFDSQGGPIPQGSQITSARLTYTLSDPGYPGRARVFELLVDWNESVTYQDFAGDGVPGVQPTEYGNFVADAPAPLGTNTINVTASLTRWSADPASNKGWVVFADNSDLVRAWSSEAPTPILRPILTVIIDEGPATGELVRSPYLQLGTPTSMSIVWDTDLPSDSRVRYGPSPAMLDQTASQAAPTTHHEMGLTNLSPATKYYYDVGSAARVLAGGDAEHYFVTSPQTGAVAKVDVWLVGDAANGGTRQAEVRDAMLAATNPATPSLLLYLGDVYPGGSALEFTDHFFTPYRTILRSAVAWPTLGSHELKSSDIVTETGPYFDSFVLPAAGEAGGVPSGSQSYYSFDFGNVHFMCISSHHGGATPMYAWLAADAAATGQDWLIAFLHYPPYTKGSHDSDLELSLIRIREEVVPILEAAGVDLLIAGHSHDYERSFLIDGAYDTPTTAQGHIVDGGDGMPGGDGAYVKPPGLTPHRGTVYVVSGNGGTPVSGTGGHPVMFFDEVDWGSVLLSIDDQQLSVRHLRSDGVVTDSFDMLKVARVPAMRPWLRMGMAMLVGVAGVLLLWRQGRRDRAALLRTAAPRSRRGHARPHPAAIANALSSLTGRRLRSLRLRVPR